MSWWIRLHNKMRDGLLFQLVCLACLSLTIAYDVPNNDKDCSSLVICGRKVWAEKKGVCASDGNFYHTLCGMRVYECETGKDIFPVKFTDDRNDCVRGKRERRGTTPGARHRSRRAPRQVILERFSWNITAREHRGFFHPNITINVLFQTSKLGDTISGRGLWKAGLFRSQFEDGFGDRSGPYVQQLLSEEEASMKVRTGRPYSFSNLETVYDLNEVGCSDFQYLCIEFSQGDNPRPAFEFTITSLTGTAVLCQEIPCYGRSGEGVDRTCRQPCPDDAEPVCGNNGITYSSSCEIDNIVRCSPSDLSIAYFGECRLGVIMESMFWSAGVVGTEPGELTELEMEAFLFANESSESVAGTNLWRMGVFGSMNANGTGPKFGYIPQILEGKSESQTLVSGLPLPIRARFRFDVATIGCNEFNFMCMEFTRNDDAEPFFPFQTNSGKKVFTSCRAAPCDPLASLSRMAIGPISWRSKRILDCSGCLRIDANISISSDSDVIRGQGLWRVGIFGSKSAVGNSSERFNYVRQVIDPAQASLPVGPGSKLSVSFVLLESDILRQGCSKFSHLCLEIAKGDQPEPDFVFHNDAQKPVLSCASLGCPENQGPPKPRIRLTYLDFGLRLVEYRIGSPSNVSVSVTIGTSDRSAPLSGTHLWKLGLFTSRDGSQERNATRDQYRKQILDEAAASTPITPGMPLEFTNIPSLLDVTGMGCRGAEFNFICISFAKGDSPDPDFDLRLNNDEAVSCRRMSCVPAAQSQKTALFQSAAVNWESQYNPDDYSNIDVTMTLTPDTGSDTIRGRNLWRMGIYASDSPQGTGTKYGYQENILDQTAMQTPSYSTRNLVLRADTLFDTQEICGSRNRHPYLCVEMGKNDASSTDFTIPIRGGVIKSCRTYNCQVMARYTSLGGNIDVPQTGTRFGATINVTPDRQTQTISGDGLWKVAAFASTNAQGTGSRYGEVRNILDRQSQRAPLRAGRDLSLTGEFNFPNAADLGCRSEYQYLCLEFAKGDRPTMDFEMQSSVMCQEQQCRSTPGGSGGSSGGSSGGNGNVARYSRMGAGVQFQDTSLTATLSVTPASNTDYIVGDGLWRVSAFGSRNAQGTGNRNGEVYNILDRQSLRVPLRAGTPMELTGTFDFPNAADLGCTSDYRYLCFEFAKGDRPSMRFTMQPNVMCREQQCSSTPGGSTGGSGSTGGTHGRQARYTNVAAEASIPSRGTRVRSTIRVTPAPDTDLIGGDGLWRVSAFGSSNSQGRGTRNGEVRDTLDYLARRKTLQPPTRGDDNIMELSGSFNFPNVADLGCSSAYRYLCFEFAKGDDSTTDFSMEPRTVCSAQECAGGSSGTPGGSNPSGGSGGSGRPTGGGSMRGKTVTIRNLAWAYDPGTSSTIDASVNLDVEPGTDFEGSNLWRLGLFASDSSRGDGRREDEVRQILRPADRSRPITTGRAIPFVANAGSEIRGLGCEGKRYLCLEFGKDSNPNPPFTIQNRNMQDDTWISCKLQQCNLDPEIRVNSVRPTAIEIREGERNEVEFDVTVKYDPSQSTSIRGQSLWKLAAWGAKTGGDVNPKVSYTDQVLSSFQQDTMVDKTSGSSFDFGRLSHTFDLTGRKCTEMKFFCVRLRKNTPVPDFALKARNDDMDRLMGCLKVRCVAAAKPMFTVSNIGIVREPYSAGRAGRSNPMTLDINVNYDRATTTDVGGDPQWAIEAWGSAKKNGKGRKISPSRLDLGFEGHQTFELGGVLRFNDIPYDFDLTNQECQKTKFLCLRLSKTGAGFTLKGKPNSKALTKCAPYSCLPAQGSTGSSSGSNPSSGNTDRPSRPSRPSGPTDVKIVGFNARFDPYSVSDGEVPITMHADWTATPDSGEPTGPNLWHMAVYGNSRSDGSDPDKRGYTGNVLTPKKAKTSLVSGGVMTIDDIRFNFNMAGIGCYPYNYLCIEYGQGSSTSYTMSYPQGGKAVTCQLQQCNSKK